MGGSKEETDSLYFVFNSIRCWPESKSLSLDRGIELMKTVISRARKLRKESTPAERFLWLHLRCKRFYGLKFRRQHPIGHYIVDFACIEKMIIVELDGSQHASQVQKDMRRTKYLKYRGYTVLRFWNFQVLEEINSVLEVIGMACSLP